MAGIFGLRDVRAEQIVKTTVETTVGTRQYGYFAGGETVGDSCIIDRLDFSNETVSQLGNRITQTRQGLEGVSNSQYGYFGGGFFAPPTTYVCTIDRLDFSNETVAAPGTYQLTQARTDLAAVSTPQYGYFAGGYFTPPFIYFSTIDRLDFSNETVQVPTAPAPNQLTQEKARLSAVYNSNYGYFGGGLSLSVPGVTCIIERLDFSNETVDVPGTLQQLTQARQRLAGVSNSNYGYFGGGYFNPPLTYVNTIDRLDFSNETVSAPGNDLISTKQKLAAVSSPQYGYFGGGGNGSPAYTSTIERLDFSSETIVAPTGYYLTQARSDLAAVSTPVSEYKVTTTQTDWPELAEFGYFGGGDAPPNIQTSSIERLDFSNETFDKSTTLTQAREYLTAVSNSNYGYFCGGLFSPGSTTVSTIDRLDFSNETVLAPGNNLLISRWSLAGVSNSNYGYFGAGARPSPYSSYLDRLDFSNETVSAPGNNLTQARRYISAVSSPQYGYFGGGEAPAAPTVSTIDRLDFSNETVTGPPIHGINLPQEIERMGGLSNSNYGYFAGGTTLPAPSVNTINRLDFSNETVSAPGNNLTQAKHFIATASNSNYGYFAGGFLTKNTNRLDFSNETISSPGNNVINLTHSFAGVSTKPTTETVRKLRKGEFDASGVVYSNYGYFAGGTPPGTSASSTIDRLDFSSETTSAPGNDITQSRNRLAAVSNSNYGYFAGGYGSNYTSTFDRLDFSTETVAGPPVHGLFLTQARYGLAGVSSPEYGYFAGGSSASVTYDCTIDRLDFSNETVSAPGISPGQLTQARDALAAVSNSQYGYFGGGFSNVSTIDRLDFSNETVAAPGTYQLTQTRGSLAAVSNSNYGYFGGGQGPIRVCTIDRLDFSNETVSAPGNNLTQARDRLAAVSNSNYGYFGGGYIFPPATFYCTIDRLDFATEIVTGPPIHGINLTEARRGSAGINIPLNQTRHAAPQEYYTAYYGYFAGGRIPNYTCATDRLDFATETITVSTPLTQGRSESAAVSTREYGYIAGGYTPEVFTTAIDRLDFSNDATSRLGYYLSQARRYLAGVSNYNYGYFGGGSSFVSTIDRLDFATETVEAPGTYQLTQAREGLAGVSSPDYGYFGGGGPLNFSTIDRLDFATETVVGPATLPPQCVLTQARNFIAAVSSPQYGYFAGGTAPGLIYYCTIDRLDFSTETVQVPTAPAPNQLTQAREASSGVFNSNYGYFGGGELLVGPPPITPFKYSTIDRLDFATETVEAPGAYQLTGNRYGVAGVSMKLKLAKPFLWKTNKNTLSYGFGYFGGGAEPPYRGTIGRLDFSSETVSAPGNNLTQARYRLAAVSNSNYGYFAGGNEADPKVCTIDRLDFSNETTTAPGNNLTQARRWLAAVSNSNYGYFAGGDGAFPYVCTIDRLDFSNETVDVPGTLQQLTQARDQLAAVSNLNYGYFAGGEITPSVCTIDRLDFSNETVDVPGTRQQLTQARKYLTAVSNSNYGYFVGGSTPNATRVCTIDRLDFSNETVAAPGTYQLTQARDALAAVSNSNYGYFGGGYRPPAPGRVCTIDRLDFSNETIAAPGTYQLTQRRDQLAGTQVNYYQKVGIPISKAYGYFAGGVISPIVTRYCTMDRLDFSTETVDVPGTYQLTQARTGLEAVSNSNYGYFGGGQGPNRSCIIDRLDFSNETVVAPGNNLTQRRSGLAAVSNSNYGYFGGGYDTPSTFYSTIERLDFSNETTSNPPANLTQARDGLAVVSNSNYGYFGGGTLSVPNQVCTIDRLDFSSETVDGPTTLPPQCGLTQRRSGLAAVSNSNYGYFAGGVSFPSTFYCTIDRLDFSTETVTGPPVHGLFLTQNRSSLAAVSNSNYGYFGGGGAFGPIQVSTIDRLDFSNETVSTPGNNLTQARTGLAAVSN